MCINIPTFVNQKGIEQGIVASEKKYQLLINTSDQFIIASFRGKVTATDMFDLLDEVYQMEEFDPGFPMIYDFSNCTAIAYRIEVLTFIERIRKRRAGLKIKKRVGIIISSLNQKFLVKLFLELAKGIGLEVEMFEDKKSCIAWMTSNEELKQKYLTALVKNQEF